MLIHRKWPDYPSQLGTFLSAETIWILKVRGVGHQLCFFLHIQLLLDKHYRVCHIAGPYSATGKCAVNKCRLSASLAVVFVNSSEVPLTIVRLLLYDTHCVVHMSWWRILKATSASFFVPLTSSCSLYSWFTSSCTHHLITVTIFALTIYHSLDLLLST